MHSKYVSYPPTRGLGGRWAGLSNLMRKRTIMEVKMPHESVDIKAPASRNIDMQEIGCRTRRPEKAKN